MLGILSFKVNPPVIVRDAAAGYFVLVLVAVKRRDVRRRLRLGLRL
jgi:hypothetical protein